MDRDTPAAAARKDVSALIEVMRRLRDPVSGCPWDIEQTFATIAPYTLEEAYEVVDAIERTDAADLREELGDLLLQVVYHAQMANEAGQFDFADVVAGIVDKMVRRHPHVFGDAHAREAGVAKGMWERIKAEEKAQRPGADGPASALDGVPTALPALSRAFKLQKKAARIGFDWPRIDEALDKVHEEIGELRAELEARREPDRLEDEIGDLLFAVANVSRHAGIEPETALRRANSKFVRRFKAMEQNLGLRGMTPAAASLDEMEAEWQAVKAAERDRSQE